MSSVCAAVYCFFKLMPSMSDLREKRYQEDRALFSIDERFVQLLASQRIEVRGFEAHTKFDNRDANCQQITGWSKTWWGPPKAAPHYVVTDGLGQWHPLFVLALASLISWLCVLLFVICYFMLLRLNLVTLESSSLYVTSFHLFNLLPFLLFHFK